MKFLIVGSGGREHALTWKLAQEAEVFAAPGNPGIAESCETFAVKQDDAVGLASLAQRLGVDCVVVGPENPLIHGVADTLRKSGLAVVGPGAEGSQLEGSKAFAKRWMSDAKVPTAAFESFTDPEAAHSYARSRFERGRQLAVKANGAALGKGVVVCADLSSAEDAIQMMMVDRELGPPGAEIVIEDRLFGREFSLMALVSDSHYWCLPPVQDYKRVFDQDMGPNTGGMGSFSPLPWLSDAILQQAESQVIAPIVRLLAERGIDFRGVLFAGLMLDEGVPYCLEFNVRFGDPETQTIVRRLGHGLAQALLATARGESIDPPQVINNAAVSVVIASQGYPASPKVGKEVAIDPMPDGAIAFHSGTAIKDGRLVSSGGRVLAISAEALTLNEARSTAYSAVKKVHVDGARWRTDIAADTAMA